MDKKEILSRIDELMQEKGISRYELKENTDISSIIYQWRKNATREKQRVPSLRSIEKICDYLGVSLSYFFAMAPTTQREIRNKDLMELIQALSAEQIKIVEEIIKQFK